MSGAFLITEKHWEYIVINRYNLKLNGLWHLPFHQSSARVHAVSHGASASGKGMDLSLEPPTMALRQTTLFQFIGLNRKSELIPNPIIGFRIEMC